MDTIKDKINIVRDAVDFKATNRIPTFSNYYTYIILEEGYKLGDALYNNETLQKALYGFHEKYNFDYYNYNGSRNPFSVTDAVEGNYYLIDDVRDAFNIKDYQVMYGDEYTELADNPKKFLWEKVLPRKCKTYGKDPSEAIPAYIKSIEEYQKYMEMMGTIVKTFNEKYQVPNVNAAQVGSPIEFIFNQLRGIKETGIDIRRRPYEVLAAIKALEDFNGNTVGYGSFDNPQPENTIFQIKMIFLAHSIMSPKQFEKFYWPYVDKTIQKCIETGRKMQIFCESFFYRFADFFQDVPKGIICVQPEQDDVFELRKMLPNIAINGGMLSTLLGSGTKEECIDYAKKLVDEIGRDGGFIMGQNKMMTYRNDAKPENILAVQEFCRSCKG